MKLEYSLKSEAQAKCDEIHQWLIANSSPYAASVLAGQTLRWAFPLRNIDPVTKQPVGNEYVIVKDQCLPALTKAEAGKLVDKTSAAVDTAK